MRIYIEGMKEIPKSCGKCPIHRLTPSLRPTSAICPIMKGTPKDITDLFERSPNCPLREQRQPNRFNSVVQLLMDADLREEDNFIEEEEYIKMLAEMICQMFKDGPYDKEEDMATLTDKEEANLMDISSEYDRLKEENKNNEIKIKVKTEGFEEAEEKIQGMRDALDSFPGIVQIRKIENCEVNFHLSQIYTKDLEK